MPFTIDGLLKQKGWDTKYKFTIVEKPTDHLIEAFITNDWHINVICDPDLENKVKKIIDAYNKKFKKPFLGFFQSQKYFDTKRDNLDELVYFVVDHEIGHWEECPFDTEYEDQIRTGIRKGLQKAGIKKGAAEQYEPRMSNLFMDIVVNTLNSFQGYEPEKYKYGEALFYMKEGMLAGALSNIFGVFVDSQLRMSMDNKETNSLVQRFGRDYAKTRRLTKKVIKILNQSYNPFNQVDVSNVARIYKQRKKIHRNLANKKSWGKKAEKFARLLAPYLERIPLTSALFTFGDRGDVSPSDNVDEVPSGKGNPKAGDPMITVPTAYDFYSLDNLYRERVGQIRDISYAGDNIFGVPIRYLKHKRVRNNLNPRKIDFSKTLPVFTSKGVDFEFYQREAPLMIKGRHGSSGLRGYAFIIDSSGSMEWDPIKGEGEYDLCLRSVYTILKYLEDSRKSPFFSSINFSGKTIYSNWLSHDQLDVFKKTLFSYQGDGTRLEPKALRMLNQDASFKYLAIMISDGEIRNWDVVVPKVHEIINSGNEFVLFQLGEKSEFSEKLRNSGVDVKYIGKPEDLIGLSLRQVRRYS